MTELSMLAELGLENLKLLHGRASAHIAPTSESLAYALQAGGVDISKSTLSNLYLRNKTIDDQLAEQIETALHVGRGWLAYGVTTFLEITPTPFRSKNVERHESPQSQA